MEKVCTGWLGLFGGLLAVFGVVAAPITSGDTALRSARLMIAEALHLEQKSVVKRLYIAVPMFLAVIVLLVWQETNPDGFNTIWQWFGWSNQTLAVFTLWMMVVYMVRTHKAYFMVLVPALFMTLVCATFLLVSPMALGLSPSVAYVGTVIVFLIAAIWFCIWKVRDGKNANN
ncbi:carbon starvation protein CstA [Prevotella sp. CAG:924]|nr:carbon starvation protein CstA [Prevotella sp. CAG:924]